MEEASKPGLNFGKVMFDASPVRYLDNLTKDLENGLNELSEQPVKYAVSAVKDFIVDYYDVMGAAIAGFAWKDYGGKVMGDLRWPLAFIGAGAALAGPTIENCFHGEGIGSSNGFSYRSARSLTAGMAVAGYNETPHLISKVTGLAFGAISLFANDCFFKEREEKREKNIDRAWELKKEEILKRVFIKIGEKLE
ncbi:MAG: hypothetical protein Q7J54_06710 [Candidatus Woesearchaeota archaeon]|nr:hypothetical protein [Candidatus Woesearchaeota archaeon]